MIIEKVTDTLYRSGRMLLGTGSRNVVTNDPVPTDDPLGILEGTEHLYAVRACLRCHQPQHMVRSGWVHDSGYYACVPSVDTHGGTCRYCRQIIEPVGHKGWIHASGKYRCEVHPLEHGFATPS